MTSASPSQLAEQLDARLRAIEHPSVEARRAVRRELSIALRHRSGEVALATAELLVDRHRWIAYELVHHHEGAFTLLDRRTVERLGSGLAGWEDVDAFGRYVAGPAWRRGLITDDVIESWTSSPDRWWRRAALVATVPLNLRAAGGTGDTRRTLAVCARLVDDRDDMVVKALSWALRQLVVWDADAVRRFLRDHKHHLAARVRREVTNKLETGRKNPR